MNWSVFFFVFILPRFVIYPGKLSKFDSFRIGAKNGGWKKSGSFTSWLPVP